ncbi:MAG TPA: HD domain-containing phosphohydrolase [Thermoanaerobaculia bacterium]
MIPEVKQIEAQLKQILYGCVEHVQATKAALYLCSSHDLNAKTYELVTSYQYNAADRKTVTANDDLVDRLVVKRSPFFVNGVASDQRFSEMLFRQGNDRLLVSPLFSRGRLVGFIDMRDKAGKKPFEAPDVAAAQRIADDMLGVLASNKLFGVAPVALVSDPSVRPVAPSVVMPTVMPTPVTTPTETPREQPPSRPAAPFSPAATQAIEAARQYLGRRQHAAQNSGKRTITEGDLDVARMMLPAALAIPGAVLACISGAGMASNPHAAVALANAGDDAIEVLLQHVQGWLKRANLPHMTARPPLAFPFGAQPLPISSNAFTAILTATVGAATLDGLLLTVAFERIAEPQAQRAMQIFLRQIEPMVDSALATGAGRGDRQAIAERLLEPDFQKYPDLAEHCREVAAIAYRFARVLELPAAQAESVRIAALVHDAGLRLLDYERMYRRPNLTAEEMRGLAEHPVVGAALVEPLLGSDVAQAVLRHHERVDGKGYPSRLSGTQIPIGARIIQIADAWVAMTSRVTYQLPIPPEQAAARLRESSGTQFDPALVDRFLTKLGEIAI